MPTDSLLMPTLDASDMYVRRLLLLAACGKGRRKSLLMHKKQVTGGDNRESQ